MTTTRSQDKEANQKERRERTRKRKRAVKREKKRIATIRVDAGRDDWSMNEDERCNNVSRIM